MKFIQFLLLPLFLFGCAQPTMPTVPSTGTKTYYTAIAIRDTSFPYVKMQFKSFTYTY